MKNMVLYRILPALLFIFIIASGAVLPQLFIAKRTKAASGERIYVRTDEIHPFGERYGTERTELSDTVRFYGEQKQNAVTDGVFYVNDKSVSKKQEEMYFFGMDRLADFLKAWDGFISEQFQIFDANKSRIMIDEATGEAKVGLAVSPGTGEGENTFAFDMETGVPVSAEFTVWGIETAPFDLWMSLLNAYERETGIAFTTVIKDEDAAAEKPERMDGVCAYTAINEDMSLLLSCSIGMDGGKYMIVFGFTENK